MAGSHPCCHQGRWGPTPHLYGNQWTCHYAEWGVGCSSYRLCNRYWYGSTILNSFNIVIQHLLFCNNIEWLQVWAVFYFTHWFVLFSVLWLLVAKSLMKMYCLLLITHLCVCVCLPRGGGRAIQSCWSAIHPEEDAGQPCRRSGSQI